MRVGRSADWWIDQTLRPIRSQSRPHNDAVPRTVGSGEPACASRKTSGARTRHTTHPVHFCVTTTLPKSDPRSSMSGTEAVTAVAIAGGAIFCLLLLLLLLGFVLFVASLFLHLEARET